MDVGSAKMIISGLYTMRLELYIADLELLEIVVK
jgi:hypothetical protein